MTERGDSCHGLASATSRAVELGAQDTPCPRTVKPWHGWFWINLPWIALIRAYQITLGPLMGGHCRFAPTCSHYALGAFKRHNPFKAAWLTARRLLRCQPWGGGGYDPVP